MEYIYIFLSFGVYALLAALPLFIVLRIMNFCVRGKTLSRPELIAVAAGMLSLPLVLFTILVAVFAVFSIDGQVCWQECFDVEKGAEFTSNFLFLVLVMWPFILFYLLGAAVCGFRFCRKFLKVHSQND
ncbi:MAG: hypothetical protein FJX23_04635 [Alphaproteobacteria bacterium]|nr:hypothetical protein [Alphaproteobacteria bacterium]